MREWLRRTTGTGLARFRDDEGGAVTVDWVVLTGGLIIFGVLVAQSIISGSTGTSASIESALTNATVPTVSF